MTIFTQESIYQAYLDCRRKKSNTVTHAQFFTKFEKHLFFLLENLKDRKYKVGRFRCFVLTEPVVREVFAGSFRDRIVHHLLINEIEKYVDDFFIFDSFACRREKGNIFAAKRLQRGIQSCYDKNGIEPYFLQMDISSFFMSINKEKLYYIVSGLIEKIQKRKEFSDLWKDEVLYLCKEIIFNDPTQNYIRKGYPGLRKKVRYGKSLFHSKKGTGLPIGNLASQFFANVYMNEFDQFMKRKVKRNYYYRYVDDFVILGSKESLSLIYKISKSFLKNELMLELNEKKTKIKSSSCGIDFVGYIIRSKYLLPRKRNISKFRNKLAKVRIKSKAEVYSFNRSYSALKGYLVHAKTYKLLHHIHNDVCLRSTGK